MKYPPTEPICSCDECIYKAPERDRCRKVGGEILPKGRRCSGSLSRTWWLDPAKEPEEVK